MGSEQRFVSYLDIPLQHSHPEILRGHAARRLRRALPAAARARPRARAGHLPAHDLHRRLPGRDRGALRAPARVRRARRASTISAPSSTARSRGRRPPKLPDRVPPAVARRRQRRLLAAQKPIALARRQRAGRADASRCCVEGACDETEHLLEGRHRGMAPEIDGRLLINDGVAPAGTLAEVEITDAFASDLVGRIVGPAGAPGVVPAPRPERDAGRRRRAALRRDLPRGGVATIGNYDGVHRGQRAIARAGAWRARASSAFRRSSLTFEPHPLARAAARAGAAADHHRRAARARCSRRSASTRSGWCAFTPEFAAIPARELRARRAWPERLGGARGLRRASRFAFGHRREGTLALLERTGEELGFRADGRPGARARRRADLGDPDPARARRGRGRGGGVPARSALRGRGRDRSRRPLGQRARLADDQPRLGERVAAGRRRLR